MFNINLRIAIAAAVFFLLNVSIGLSQDLTESIVCPKKLIEIAEIGGCGSKVNYTEPFVNISDKELVTMQNNYSSGAYFEGGESTVYYKATDKINNTYFCIFKVKVKDEQRPEFIEFPKDMVLEASSRNGTVAAWKEPEAIDNCNAASVISSHENGSVFPIGETLVTYWAYDDSGNHVMKTFTVTVRSPLDHLVSASKH